MLWNKWWLETRSRFLIGLCILAVMAVGTVFDYLAVLRLMPLADSIDATGPIGRAIRDAAEVQRTFPGFVWSQWVTQNLAQTWTLFAVLLGSGGLLAGGDGGAAFFTLSLPVSRNQVLGTRSALGLAELLVLATVPSLAIPLFAPAIGQHYGVGRALTHAAFVFGGGAVFFSLTVFLSTVFEGAWRPILIACAVAAGLALVERLGAFPTIGVFHTMVAESYFRGGGLPWAGLLTSLTLSGALLYSASVTFARQDF